MTRFSSKYQWDMGVPSNGDTQNSGCWGSAISGHAPYGKPKKNAIAAPMDETTTQIWFLNLGGQGKLDGTPHKNPWKTCPTDVFFFGCWLFWSLDIFVKFSEDSKLLKNSEHTCHKWNSQGFDISIPTYSHKNATKRGSKLNKSFMNSGFWVGILHFQNVW